MSGNAAALRSEKIIHEDYGLINGIILLIDWYFNGLLGRWWKWEAEGAWLEEVDHWGYGLRDCICPWPLSVSLSLFPGCHEPRIFSLPHPSPHTCTMTFLTCHLPTGQPWTEPPKPWAKINLSSSKLFLRGILITAVKSWLTYHPFFKDGKPKQKCEATCPRWKNCEI